MKESKLIEPMFEKDFEEDSTPREVFSKNKLHMGRMIGASKGDYRRENPDNVIVFNANIMTEIDGKIWFGDIDITKEFVRLENVAKELNKDLYILSELDGRFENESKAFEFYKEKAVGVIKCK